MKNNGKNAQDRGIRWWEMSIGTPDSMGGGIKQDGMAAN